MVNRVLQQKVVKQRRMRREWARRFSMKGSGPIGPPGHYDSKGEIIPRYKATKFVLDRYLVAKFKFNENSNEAIYARHRGLHTDMTPDKEIVLVRRVQSRSGAGTLQGTKEFVRHILYERETVYRVLFMGGDENFFVEIRPTDSGSSIVLTSNIYPNKEYAMRAHISENIMWKSVERIIPPQPS